MGSQAPITIPHPAIKKLHADIAQQEETVAKLRERGHIYTDAERHLNELKRRLQHLR